MSAPTSPSRARLEFDQIPAILDEVEVELNRRIEQGGTEGCRVERLSEDYLKVICDDGVHLSVFDATKDEDVRLFVDTEVCGSIVRYGDAQQLLADMSFRKLKDTLEVMDAGGIEAWREAGFGSRFHRIDI